MEILGIGMSEFVFILIIAIIVLGPKDMQKAGKTVGRWLNQFITSDGWKALQKTSQEIRKLPTKLMREANMEIAKTDEEIRKSIGGRPTPPASASYRPIRQIPPKEAPAASETPPVIIETPTPQKDDQDANA